MSLYIFQNGIGRIDDAPSGDEVFSHAKRCNLATADHRPVAMVGLAVNPLKRRQRLPAFSGMTSPIGVKEKPHE